MPIWQQHTSQYQHTVTYTNKATSQSGPGKVLASPHTYPPYTHACNWNSTTKACKHTSLRQTGAWLRTPATARKQLMLQLLLLLLQYIPPLRPICGKFYCTGSMTHWPRQIRQASSLLPFCRLLHNCHNHNGDDQTHVLLLRKRWYVESCAATTPPNKSPPRTKKAQAGSPLRRHHSLALQPCLHASCKALSNP